MLLGYTGLLQCQTKRDRLCHKEDMIKNSNFCSLINDIDLFRESFLISTIIY